MLAASAEDSVLTGRFAVEWDAPHRVLRSCIDAAERFQGPIVGETEWGGAAIPIVRWSVMSPDRATRGEIAAMALYAGRSVECVREVKPAAEIVAELMTGAEALLHQAAPPSGATT